MVELLIILLGTTMLSLFATSRLEGYVRVLTLQGVLLFLLVIAVARGASWPNIAFLIFETVGVKTIILPTLLMRTIRKSDLRREIEANISQFYSILFATGILVLGFIAAYWTAGRESEIRPLFFGVSVSMVVSSLFLILTRKRIVTHILCFMVLENGIFLLSLSVANEMPMVVNLGVLLDLFMAVFLLVIFSNKIREMFDGDHIDMLTELKE